VQVAGVENIPADGPVLFTVNHQNAFLDALLVATSNKRHTHFLARADVFRFSTVRKFFNSMNMMPIYRLRDGRDRLSNNHEVFQKCFNILHENHALMLFPEANHHQRRLLLPLSKGFTRIALGMDKPIIIIPVGLNYTHHRRFGASVSINYGKPLSTRPYLNGNSKHNRQLMKLVSEKMQTLITHIPDDQHYQKYEDHLNLQRTRYLNPDRCNRWVTETDPNSLAVEETPPNHQLFNYLINGVSWLLNFPPLVLCQWALKKIGDPVFSSSIKFIAGIILFPIYYLTLVVCLYLLCNSWLGIPLMLLAPMSMWLRKLSIS
jgi:1-acyl-sn-glycerol-3-phosphate acyltransferase